MRVLRSGLGIIGCLFGFSLLVVPSGCANVKTGPATAPGDDDDDDGSTPGPTGTATPLDDTPGNGPPPESIGGWFSIGNIHAKGNDPPAGLGGSGFFSATEIPLFWAEPWEALFAGYPNIPLDTCGWGYGASIAIGGSGQVSLAAGDLSISSSNGNGSFFFLPLGGLQLYIAQSMAGVYVTEGNSQYTLTGTGDQVGPFTTTFQGPADIRVTQPSNLTTLAGTRVIDRTQDFPLKWESEHDGLPVFVYLMRKETQEATPVVVLCKFVDDGDGVIPASAFQMLEPSAFGVVDALQILKYRVHTFSAPNATGLSLVNFASGYDIEVTYE